MEFPKLKPVSAAYETVDSFGGYNARNRIGSGEFADMKNLSSDHYPVLAPRGNRGFYRKPASPQGIIAKEMICYVDGADFIAGDETVPLGLSVKEENCPKQLVSMGAYVIVLPDKKYVNTKDLTDFGDIEAKFVTEGEVSFTPCEESLIRISAPAIGSKFNISDGVMIDGIEDAALQKLCQNAVIQDKGEDFITIAGLLEAESTQRRLRVRRAMPAMDHLVEAGNRLWGCRYGLDDEGNFVNELYASKLGDFRNWNCFQGLSTDSYRASCGTDGPFTGAITYLGMPHFFKEQCLHKVYGSYPAAFRIQDTACRGVQQGCGRSLAIAGETLFYRARGGVCAYDGALPVDISAPLGDSPVQSAVAGALGSKYYISMEKDGIWELFVFDASRALWHKEDDLQSDGFAAFQGELYCIDGKRRNIITMRGSGIPDSAPVSWMAQTGRLGIGDFRGKYLTCVFARLQLESGARAAFFVRYDGCGDWEHLCTVFPKGLGSICLPLRLRRCDFAELRIEGEGMVKLYSLTKKLQQGSEKA